MRENGRNQQIGHGWVDQVVEQHSKYLGIKFVVRSSAKGGWDAIVYYEGPGKPFHIQNAGKTRRDAVQYVASTIALFKAAGEGEV